MNAVAPIEAAPQPRRSITITMADRYGMDHRAFEATLRATVFKSGSAEEFAAFLLVANEYGLNPVTKEIYAFPAKGGGIVPVVSIDGWMNLINSHPKFDGMQFEEQHDQDGKLLATRCMIYRKDRSHPIAITEYLEECVRSTEPWKMKHRMLRHKAAIQCARYAFGFAGIYDEDEAEKVADGVARAAPPMPPLLQPSAAPTPPMLAKPPQPAPVQPQPASIVPDASNSSLALDTSDPEAVFKAAEEAFGAAADIDALDAIFESDFEPIRDGMIPPDADHLMGLYNRARRRFEP